MSSSIRETILEAIETKLATIRTSGGFATDVGASVQRGVMVSRLGDLPVVIVAPVSEEAESKYGATTCDLVVSVSAVLALSGRDRGDLVEDVLADLVKCLSGQTVGDGRALYVGSEIFWPELGEQSLVVMARFSITYTTAVGDPYTAK